MPFQVLPGQTGKVSDKNSVVQGRIAIYSEAVHHYTTLVSKVYR